MSAARLSGADVAPRIASEPTTVFREIREELGDAARVRARRASMLVLHHPRDVSHVLVECAQSYPRTTGPGAWSVRTPRPPAQSDIPLAIGRVEPSDMDYRRRLHASMARAALDSQIPRIRQRARELVGSWSCDESTDLTPIADLAACELVFEVLFSETRDDVAETLDDLRHCAALFPSFGESKKVALKKAFGIRARIRAAAAYERLVRWATQQVELRMAAPNGRDGLVSTLARLGRNDGLSVDQIVSSLLGLLAVQRATGVASATALSMLGTNPGLAEAIRAAPGDAAEHDRSVRGFVCESLRLEPPTKFLFR